MVAVFGTMAADGVHDGAGISDALTTPLLGAVVGAIDSAFLFGAMILVPLILWWRGQLNSIAAFWIAYVLTRRDVQTASGVARDGHLDTELDPPVLVPQSGGVQPDLA